MLDFGVHLCVSMACFIAYVRRRWQSSFLEHHLPVRDRDEKLSGGESNKGKDVLIEEKEKDKTAQKKTKMERKVKRERKKEKETTNNWLLYYAAFTYLARQQRKGVLF